MVMPLEGIRVLDWTVWQTGAVASAMLGDMGAEVIKIEDRVTGDPARGLLRVSGKSADVGHGRALSFEYANVNKKSITVDLKKEKGKEIIYRLAKKSDVFVQNYRYGVAARLGIDYPTLSKYNPKLIYANCSAYGPNGPEREEPAFDYLGMARSGYMVAAAEPGEAPRRVSGGTADHITAVTFAYGIMTALVARERYGIGQEVNASLLGSMMWIHLLNLTATLLVGPGAGEETRTEQSRTKVNNPLWNHYRCSDDKYIALACMQSDRYWATLCKAIGRPELEKDPRFIDAGTRTVNSTELVTIMDAAFVTKPVAYWMTKLREFGDFICCEVKSFADLVDDPQVLANDYIINFDHPVLGKVKQVGSPVQLSKTPSRRMSEAPEFGQHTEEVLMEIGGYSWEEITELKEQKVI